MDWTESSSGLYRASFSDRPRASMDTERSTSPLRGFPLARQFSHPLLRTQDYAVARVQTPYYAAPVELSPDVVAPPSFSRPPPNPPLRSPSFKTLRVLDLRFHAHVSNEMPDMLSQRDIFREDWEKFVAVSVVLQHGYIAAYECLPF